MVQLFLPYFPAFNRLLYAQTSPFDLLITGARVIDGSGGGVVLRRYRHYAATPSPPWARWPAPEAAIRIDAHGSVAAPGFIDIHSHGRRGIFAVPTAENYLEGVTTIVEGPDRSSPCLWRRSLDKVRQTPISIKLFAPWWGRGAYASWSSGWPTGKPRPRKSKRMKGLAAQAMRDGAFGLSTGLFYVAWKLHAHRGSDRAGQGGGPDGWHPHLAHARGGGARAR